MAILFKKDTFEIISKIFEKIEIQEQYRNPFLKRVADLFENSKVVFNDNIFEMYGGAVYDFNPLHQDEEYAKSIKGMNFETTPVFGTLISGNGESLIDKIADEFNLIRTKKILYSGNHVKYNGALYPGEELIWHPEKVISVTDNENNVLGFNLVFEGRKDNKKIVTNTAKFRYNRNSFGEEEELGKMLAGEDLDVVASYVFNLNHGDINDKQKTGGLSEYRFCTGYDHTKFPLLFSGALVPAGLLKLCHDKTGVYDGSYGAMDFDFYSRPKLGNFNVFIKNIAPPSVRRGKYTYNFKGVVVQEGKPILSGKFKCFSDKNLSA